MDEGFLAAYEMKIFLVEPLGLLGQQARLNRQARHAQVLESFAGDFRVGVFDGRDDALDACVDERVRAGRRPSVMRVRLKRDVSGRARCPLASLFQRQRLCMLESLVEIKALADDLASVAYEDAADERARTDLPAPARSQLKRATHHALIQIAIHHCSLFKQAVDVLHRVEDYKIVHLLADSGVANGQVQLFGDGDGDAALGRAVELGQNYSGHARDLQELSRLLKPVLSRHGIHDEQRLVRRALDLAPRHALHLLKLGHQVRLVVQAPGRVHDEHVGAARLRRLERVEEDGRGVCAGLLLDERDAGALGPDGELV